MRIPDDEFIGPKGRRWYEFADARSALAGNSCAGWKLHETAEPAIATGTVVAAEYAGWA